MSASSAGGIAIKVLKGDVTITVRTLETGQSFGELALLKKGGRRAADCVTTSDTELLTIDGETYRKLLGKLQQQEIAMKAHVLRRCKLFR